METTKEEIIKKVIYDLPHYSVRENMSDDEWYGWFEEVYDKAVAQQSTSQKETIERLREALQNTTSSLSAHIGGERAKEWVEVQQAEQLLKETEQ